MKKRAVISIDVEDWYHLDYFKDIKLDKSQSVLKEGIGKFLNILKNHDIKSTFFIVGELISENLKLFNDILDDGHEIAGHSYTHTRPLSQSLDDFKNDLLMLKSDLKNKFNINNPGYRAPCFSMDNARLEILTKFNYAYDSSKINTRFHPLYGNIKLDGYKKIQDNIYKKNNMIEFELPTIKFLGKKMPISGGGYLRILPWFFFKFLLKKYLKKSDSYFFFIHPFELTNKKIILPKNTSFLSKLRFEIGRSKASKRFKNLIKILKEENFEFVTFSDLKQEIKLQKL